jgi:signal transduction histidine kinase
VEIYLIIGIAVLSIAFLTVLTLYLLHKRQIELLRLQIEFIIKNETNLSLTLNVKPRELTELAKTINILLKSGRDKSKQLLKMQKLLKSTIIRISHDLRTP